MVDQGDLSTYFGYENIKAKGYALIPGKVYPKSYRNLQALSQLDFRSLLKEGYTYIRVETLEDNKAYTNFPIMVLGPDVDVMKPRAGQIPSTFLLQNEGRNDYAIINGFVYDLINGSNQVKNALIRQ